MGSSTIYWINASGLLAIYTILGYYAGYFGLPWWFGLINSFFIGVGVAVTIKEILWVIEQINFYRFKKKMEKEHEKQKRSKQNER